MGSTGHHGHIRCFEVDLEAGQLRKNGRRARLQEQPFRVLALMLEKPGRVVTREELQDKVWPDTHVDFDHSLNTAINKIREALGDTAANPRFVEALGDTAANPRFVEALGDTAANPRFVETLPGRGYRFLAPVEGAVTQAGRDVSVPPKEDPERTIGRQRLALIGAAAAFAIAALALFLSRWSGEPSRTSPLRRYSITRAESISISFRRSVVISPDGRHIAYVARSGQSGLSLWVHDLTKDAAREITSVRPSASPFWSPDSRFLAFNTGNELRKVSITGGSPVTVCRLDELGHGTWGPDGASIVLEAGAFGLGKLYQVSASGGEPRLLAEADGAWLGEPHFLPYPRESYLLCTLATSYSDPRIILWNLDNSEETVLTAGVFPVYSPTGHILYQLGWEVESIWALPFSMEDLEPMGEPFAVAEGAQFPSLASDGTLVYFEPSRAGLQRLVWRDRQGRKVGEIGQPQKGIFVPSLSPDGRYVGVEGLEESTGRDVWLHEVERPIKTRLTFDAATDSRSIWSPDSKEVAFWSERAGGTDLFIKPVDGSEEALEVLAKRPDVMPEAWSPDGKHLIYHSGPRLYSLERQPDSTWAEPVPYTHGDFNETAAQFSPDSRFVAYCSNESGRIEVYVRPFPAGPGKWQVSQDGGEQPRWSRDGKELFYVRKDTLYTTAVSTQPAFTVGATTELFTSPDLEWPWRHPTYDISLDGQRFVTVESIGEAPPPRIRIVQNWFEEFRDRKEP